MPVELTPEVLDGLKDVATRLRIRSVRATSAAGSGHPTSCASAAEVMTALFFSVMRYDPKQPDNPANDFFILSKGHAAPVLYAAWCEAGYIPEAELLNLRKIDSDLEGHPPTTLPFVDVATGSLGQGLCVGLGMALNAKLDKRDQRIFVLMGDGEIAEGSVWEAASMASHDHVDNLIATVDVNRLGQSEPTALQHDMATYKARWEAFGWNAHVVDGHDLTALLDAYAQATTPNGKPTVILAKTYKGKGISFAEDKEDWHGKPFPKGEKEDQALAELQAQLTGAPFDFKPHIPSGNGHLPAVQAPEPSPYKLGDSLATRQAYGAALAALARTNPRVIAVDGDVKNSTYTQDLEAVDPSRFFQGYIAEQNMVGVAMGFATRGKIAFAATFACFLSRAYDFLRMAAISGVNIKLVGTHAGVSIGEDGASQMGLEDLAMTSALPNYTVLYPSDGASAWQAIHLVASLEGPCYVRTSRPKTPTIYGPGEKFAVGKCKVVRSSDADKVTVVGAGVTLFEALKAADTLAEEGIAIRVIDLFSVWPADAEGLRAAAKATGGYVITVEDHFPHGGVGDAVCAALAKDRDIEVHKMAVPRIPRSGPSDALLDMFGISAKHIVAKVKSLIG